MNKTKYLQRDGRWGGLPYPKKPCYIRAVGCGEVSIANILIEMEQYRKYTPATIQPYCKRYGAPNCDGTYLSGICAMMKHYGLTNVKECDTMHELWVEMKKGNRVAVLLMGSRPGGSKKIHWTSGGHFVAAVDFKIENGLHYLYIKDPWTDDKNRNGWLSYRGYLKGDIVGVYVGKLAKAKADAPAVTKSGKLTVDGIGGTATIKAMQKFFKVEQDGYIGDQIKKLNVYYPSITAVKYGKGKSGSETVKALQKWLGLTKDGIIGKGTTAKWQKKLRDLGYLAKNEKIDGLFGVKSMKAWQRFLNDQLYGEGEKKPTDETPKEEKPKEEKPKDKLQPWFDAMVTQFKWSKNQKYKFNDHPNVANSKEEGTCITFPSVSLQRIKLLPKGKYFYMNPKTNRIAGNGAAYVLEHTEIYKVFYPNKTVKQLWKEGKIKVGDIVGYDDPAYHTMVFMGFNSKGEPIYNTMGHKKGLKVTYPAYAKRKVGMIVRLKKAVK